MHIEELHLQNFRGFQELKLKLPPDLAVFIGVNGSGKSSILDSIAILLSQFVSAFRRKDLQGLKGKGLRDDDININSDMNFNNICVAIDSNTTLSWNIIRFKDGQHSNNTEAIQEYAVQILQDIEDKPDLSLPIFVYYQTQRIVINGSSGKYIAKNQFDAYRASTSTITDFRDFFEWFKEEEEYENEIRLRENIYFRNKNLEIVRKALETFLEGFPNTQFSDLHIVRVSSGSIRRLNKPSLVIKKNGENFKLEQLSEGEKTLLMLVVDIARRLAILNPSITDPSELLQKGTGIILIDEIDLHLHPQWQRIVIPSFRKTFPNCQFIVTTHSPQVLSGVKRENVFILEDSKIIEFTPHTFGRDSNSILFEVMGVEKRPAQMQERIDNCFELIDDGRLEEAKIQLKELSNLLGENDLDIVKAHTIIDFLNRVE